MSERNVCIFSPNSFKRFCSPTEVHSLMKKPLFLAGFFGYISQSQSFFFFF